MNVFLGIQGDVFCGGETHLISVTIAIEINGMTMQSLCSCAVVLLIPIKI